MATITPATPSDSFGAPIESATAATARRWRSWRWVLLTLVVLAVIAAVSAYLTAPRPGLRMDPESTDTDGAHALVTLLGDNGVEVVVANSVGDVERAARPDALILVVQSQYLTDDSQLNRLAKAPGDLLLVEPTARTREALAPDLRKAKASLFDSEPNCDLREANRAGSVRFGSSVGYEAKPGKSVTSCYGGALVRYRGSGRTVTVVGSNDFMTNGNLSQAGNAALAMNLAGERARLIWFAPHHAESRNSAPTSLSELIPPNVTWLIWQLCVVVLLLALWKGRRIGPLVAEELPVVVRASETVEGRGRLYRSRRARDRAADALRTATLQRLIPQLGLGTGAPPTAVVPAVAQRSAAGGGFDEGWVAFQLFGPAPATDDDLLQLARALDEIERQVKHS